MAYICQDFFHHYTGCLKNQSNAAIKAKPTTSAKKKTSQLIVLLLLTNRFSSVFV